MNKTVLKQQQKHDKNLFVVIHFSAAERASDKQPCPARMDGARGHHVALR
jgi:hypothetical protein